MKPIIFENDILKLLDQTKLPSETVYVECPTYTSAAEAIKNMIVRGAPAIAVSAAFALVMGAKTIDSSDRDEFLSVFRSMCDLMKNTRPTAVNLFGAVDRIYEKACFDNSLCVNDIKRIIDDEAYLLYDEDILTNKMIGQHGNTLIKHKSVIMTHCNAGALATCDYGTALGVIRAAHNDNKQISVIANETRPYLQGARLTCWELMQDKIPVTLICDNMAGHFLKSGKVDCVIVGADRIAANGDTANKIGTYSISVIAKENNIPFYVAAPITTIDFKLNSGDLIPIEERNPDEVTHILGKRIAPLGVDVLNPAFDVTPAKYITGIITEKGILYPTYVESLGGHSSLE